MPSAKSKKQLSETTAQGSPAGQSLKQSRKASKNKAKTKLKKTKTKKAMNLPTRLARLLKYKHRTAQIVGLGLKQRVPESTVQGQGSDTRNGTNNSLKGDEGCLSTSSLCKGYSFFHQKTFASGDSTSTTSNSEHGSSGRESDLKGGSAVQCRLIPKEKIIALDCEMVGVGPEGRTSALARCSIVDYDCNILYDAYVKPELEILHYRTPWSGIREHHMKGAVPFREAQQQIANILRRKILVGHSLKFDIQVLELGHPREDIRDTSTYRGLRELAGMALASGQHPGLKKLTRRLFGHSIQKGEHCSVEDAKATMNLYKLVERKWEEERVSTFPDCDFRASFMDDHFWPDDLGQ